MENGGNKNNLTGNIFSQEFGFSEVNPFGRNFTPQKPVQSAPVTNPVRRLNGYDSNILNNTNYEDTDIESLEYRIKEKENLVKDLDSKIKIADNYGSQNEAFVLKAKKNRILQEMDTLRKQQMYGRRVLGENSEFNHANFKAKMPVIYKIQNFISRKILAKISKKINSVVTLSDSLEKLSDINKSVNELIDINIPYGEKIQNYEKLTDYLNQANLIHSKISKTLGKRA
jgi:hypothetical protein